MSQWNHNLLVKSGQLELFCGKFCAFLSKQVAMCHFRLRKFAWLSLDCRTANNFIDMSGLCTLRNNNMAAVTGRKQLHENYGRNWKYRQKAFTFSPGTNFKIKDKVTKSNNSWNVYKFWYQFNCINNGMTWMTACQLVLLRGLRK